MGIKLKFLLSVFVFLIGSLALNAQLTDTLDLEGFLEMARQKTIDVEAAKLDLNAASLEFQITKAGFMPQLSANANLPNYTRTSTEVIQPDGNIRFQRISNNNSALGLSLSQNIAQTGGTLFMRSDLQRFDDFQNKSTFYNGIPIRVGLIQPLFGFNSLKWDRKLAPIRLQEANKQYLADLEAINRESTRLFFELLIARVNLDIANSNFENNQDLFEIAEERHQLGKISDSDLLQLRVSLLNAQRNQQSTLQSLGLASSRIYAYLGLPYNGNLINPRLPASPNSINVDFDSALANAKKNRPEIEGFIRRDMEANRALARAKGNGGFQADLVASFGLTRSASQVSEIYQSPQDEQFAQITLSVPILDWKEQKSRVKLAQNQLEYTKKLIAQQQLSFDTEIRQIVDQFTSLQRELQLAQELRNIAQERFDIARESFVLGAISTTELSIAQQEKDQALRSYVLSLSTYWQTYYELRRLTLFDFSTGTKIQ